MSTPDAVIIVAPGSNSYITGTNQYDVVFATTSNVQGFAFGYNTPYLRITSNGFVGIGMSNPTSMLQVAGSILPSADSVYDLGSSNLRWKTLYIASNTLDIAGTKLKVDSTGSLVITNSNNSNANIVAAQVLIGSGSNLVSLQLDTSNNLQFVSASVSNGQVVTSSNAASVTSSSWSNNSNNVFLIGSNVGIGKSNPQYNLDVFGNINFTGTLTSNGVPFSGGGGGIGFSNSGYNLFVLAPSNVGIGTSNPLAQLHVASNMRVDGAVTINNALQFTGIELLPGLVQNNYTQLIATTSNIQGYSNLVFGSSGSNGTMFSIMSNTSNDAWRFVSGSTSNQVFTLTGNGRLGIANTTPQYPLDVTGITRITSNVIIGTGNSTLTFAPGMFFNGSTFIACNNAMSIDLPNTGVVTFGDTVLFTGGNVGIATTGPSYMLDVAGPIRSTMCNIVGTGGTNMLVLGSNEVKLLAGGAAHYSMFNSNGNFQINNTSANSLIGTWGTNILTLTNNNFMGIGTTTPNCLLAVAGGHTVGAAYSNVTPPTNGMIVQGNVGIGISSPASVLDVNGNSIIRGSLTFSNNVSSVGLTTNANNLILSSGTVFSFSSAANCTLSEGWGIRYTGLNTQPFTISNASLVVGYVFPNNTNIGTGNAYISGNMGISTSNPAYSLDVNGSFRTSNIFYVVGSNVTIGSSNSSIVPSCTLTLFHSAPGNISLGIRRQDFTQEYVAAFKYPGGSVASANSNINATLALGNANTDPSLHATGNIVTNSSIGAGTSTPQYTLDVNGTFGTSSGNNLIYSVSGLLSHIFSTNASQRVVINQLGIYPATDNSIGCGISGNRWSAVYAANGAIQTSDSNEKIMKPLQYGINELMQVNPIQYQWKSQLGLSNDNPEKDYEYYGVIADELDKIFPELVYNQQRPYQLNYTELIPVCINAIKQLKSDNDKLRDDILSLTNRLNAAGL